MKTQFHLIKTAVLVAVWVQTVVCRAQADFVAVTNTVLTSDQLAGTGAAWADVDGDGLLDLIQANYAGAIRFFHNEGNGGFTKRLAGIDDTGVESYGVACGDFNNDGLPDLLIANGYDTGGPNYLYENRFFLNGFLSFRRLQSGPASTVNSHSAGCSWADYDRDGFLDLFVANSGEPSELWHNKGRGTFERVLTGAIVTNIADSVGAAWADYDNDGWPDLFVANGFGVDASQRNFLYHNNHDGTFTQIKVGAIVNDTGHSTGAAWGDYDNDGNLDLFVTRNGGVNLLYHNNGDGTFARVTSSPVVSEEGTFVGCAWADYDNDGWLDLFIGSRVQNQPNSLYHNVGNGTFAKVATGSIAADIAPDGGCAWGDYDRDGFSDLFVSVFDPFNQSIDAAGQSRLYHNEGNANRFLRVGLRPTQSNRSAIGVRVRVTSVIGGKSVTQLREMNSGDGFSGGMPEALFGLGATNENVFISVEWPSGRTNISPVPILRDTQEIWEPQPSSIKLLKISRNEESQITTVTVKILGDATEYYVSGTLSTGLALEHRGYALETSSDLLHWSSYDGDSLDLHDCSSQYPSPDVDPGWELYPTSGKVWPAAELFIRARDVGFVVRRITP